MRCWKNNLILDILKHKLSTVRSHLSSGQTHTDKWTGNDLAQTCFNVFWKLLYYYFKWFYESYLHLSKHSLNAKRLRILQMWFLLDRKLHFITALQWTGASLLMKCVSFMHRSCWGGEIKLFLTLLLLHVDSGRGREDKSGVKPETVS